MLDALMQKLCKELEMDSLKTEVPGVYAFPLEKDTPVLIRVCHKVFH